MSKFKFLIPAALRNFFILELTATPSAPMQYSGSFADMPWPHSFQWKLDDCNQKYALIYFLPSTIFLWCRNKNLERAAKTRESYIDNVCFTPSDWNSCAPTHSPWPVLPWGWVVSMVAACDYCAANSYRFTGDSKSSSSRHLPMPPYGALQYGAVDFTWGWRVADICWMETGHLLLFPCPVALSSSAFRQKMQHFARYNFLRPVSAPDPFAAPTD